MERPGYKTHPLWTAAMELVHRAYALAQQVRAETPLVARHLRRAAVTAPSSIAGALEPAAGSSIAESAARARGALAEIERQSRGVHGAHAVAARDLASEARRLDAQVERVFSPETPS
jgi:hypothetical protein